MSAEKHIFIHVISSLYVCVVKINISTILCKHGANNEDASLWIESFVMIKLRGVPQNSTNVYIYIYLYL